MIRRVSLLAMKTLIQNLPYLGIFVLAFVVVMLIGQHNNAPATPDNIAPALPPKAQTVVTPAGEHKDIRKAGETDEELKDSLIESFFAVM
jgi:hypothetical protein